MSGEHVRDQDWHARTGRAEEMSDLCRIKVLCYRERGPRVRIFGASAALRGPRAEARTVRKATHSLCCLCCLCNKLARHYTYGRVLRTQEPGSQPQVLSQLLSGLTASLRFLSGGRPPALTASSRRRSSRRQLQVSLPLEDHRIPQPSRASMWSGMVHTIHHWPHPIAPPCDLHAVLTAVSWACVPCPVHVHVLLRRCCD